MLVVEPEVWTIDEAAYQLSIDASDVRAALASGELEAAGDGVNATAIRKRFDDVQAEWERAHR